MGSVGLLSTALIMPIFGRVYESQLSNAIPKGVNYQEILNAEVGSYNHNILNEAKVIAGSDTLMYASILPAILILAFGILFLIRKKRRTMVPNEI